MRYSPHRKIRKLNNLMRYSPHRKIGKLNNFLSDLSMWRVSDKVIPKTRHGH
jgi:hypothetical protein